MEHLATIKLMSETNKEAGDLELELYWNGTVQIIKTPQQKSFFLAADQVRKLIAALQEGLRKLPPQNSETTRVSD
jgi:hypothetical protein